MMPFKKKIFFAFCTLSMLFCLPSCGYHMGSMMHPQIKSIAIADIKNDSREPLVIEIARQKLAEQFQIDGSLKLKSKETADCILYCRIVSVKTSTLRDDSSDDDETYRPEEFRVTVNAEFTVLIPGRSEPLIPLRAISGAVNYEYNADPQIAKIQGLKQACYNMARMAVQYTTEAW